MVNASQCGPQNSLLVVQQMLSATYQYVETAEHPLCACQSSMEAEHTSISLLRDSLAQQRSLERKMHNSLKLVLPGGESKEEADCLIDGESHIELGKLFEKQGGQCRL